MAYSSRLFSSSRSASRPTPAASSPAASMKAHIAELTTLRRRTFLSAMAGGAAYAMLPGCGGPGGEPEMPLPGVNIPEIQPGEDVFAYMQRTKGGFDETLYRQLLGASNAFKEGDVGIGVAAANEPSRNNARQLLANTKIKDLDAHPLILDDLYKLIQQTMSSAAQAMIGPWTVGELRSYLLKSDEAQIKQIMPGLTSDVIGCVVKLMNNEDLIEVGKKVFNPLPGSNLGARGYMGARIQPNSPTDNLDDIQWQVFDGWSYGVGDVVLGCNPVSSDVDSVAAIEGMLLDLLTTFGLQTAMPHCVLSHIDVQAAVEEKKPGTSGLWFQSLAGNDGANAVFDVSVQKMLDHAAKRTGQYGLYFETGQGADFTNGQDKGVDMVVLESRKYGFARALKQKVGEAQQKAGKPVQPWVHVNDVAGFIGPEVFRFKDQLVRCCLEDIVMGKLHGIMIGLDICSTLHMDVSLDDLDYCIDQIMPANPGYLMGLPTKNDPMLGYLTTAYQDHVRIRDKFGFKVNDRMWDFYVNVLGVVDANGKPTGKFGDPLNVYLQYRKRKGDPRPDTAILDEGRLKMKEVRDRGVWLAEGSGPKPWELQASLDAEIRRLYDDAKQTLWTELSDSFIATVPMAVAGNTRSADRKDYIWHPPTGEKLDMSTTESLRTLRMKHGGQFDVLIVVSDGLCSNAVTDPNHLAPYLTTLRSELVKAGYKPAPEHVVLRMGRVRAGYHVGEIVYGGLGDSAKKRAVIHVIGERPGSGHHTFSAYLTNPAVSLWSSPGKVDHNITRVVSGVADTAYLPATAAAETVRILGML
jgi:ethanolamine ammonia-lyase large subunit